MTDLKIVQARNGFIVEWEVGEIFGSRPGKKVFSSLIEVLQFVAWHFSPPYWEGKVLMQERDEPDWSGPHDMGDG